MQATLPLFKSAPDAEGARRLILLLRTAGGWRTRSQISEETGWPERRIRQYAGAAVDDAGLPIIIRWQRGFCHRAFVPAEEIARAAVQMQNQSDEQRREAIALRRLAHEKLNAGTQRPGSPDVSLATETRKPGSLK
jgi:hypothetical protein